MYCIAGFEKVKDNQKLSQIASHNYRLHLTQAEAKRIDSSRSHLNKVLLNPLSIDTESTKDLSDKINGYYAKNNIEVKKNSVLAIDLMLTTSPEFFQDNEKNTWHKNGKIKPQFQKKIDDWVAAQIKFVKKEFGEGAIKSAVLHLDETTPHIHFLITPEETKELKYKNQYGTQSKIVTSLNADRWNPNFWNKFLRNYEKANFVFGLKKGEEKSLSENVSLKDFANMVGDASKSDYSKAIKRLVDDIGYNLSILNTKDGVKKLLVEKLLPSLNPMLKHNKALKKLLELDRVKEYKALNKLKEELKTALEDAQARKSLYIEAINEKQHDAKLLLELERENSLLKKETMRLKSKQQSEEKTQSMKVTKNVPKLG